MKQLLQQYAAYNLWANKKIIETANLLSEEKINKEIVSSFPSVYKTFLHLMEVENAWWERLKLAERPAMSGWFKEIMRICQKNCWSYHGNGRSGLTLPMK